MNEKIGFAAGEIWNILREKDELSVSKLKSELKKKSFSDLETSMALGWLLRENKINFKETKSGARKSQNVSLK